jgi:hypothetical protein
MPTTVLVKGNTYPHRGQLRAMGGRWDPTVKGWRMPASVAEKALALVSGDPSPAQRGRPTGCACGSRVDGYGALIAGSHNCAECLFDD